MRLAVVDTATGAVVNVIVAEPDDPGFPGMTLIPLGEQEGVDESWSWSEQGWIAPPPPAFSAKWQDGEPQ